MNYHKEREAFNNWASELEHKKRILLIEDDLGTLISLTYMIEKCGHVVEVAKDVTMALDKLQRSRFDVAMVNLKLPRTHLDTPSVEGGREVLLWCKAHCPYMPTPIVTGFDEESPQVQEALKDVNPRPPVFTKPFDLEGVKILLGQLGLPIGHGNESRRL